MSIITEELLMAYADGELEGAEHATNRARIEAAMKIDADIASRVMKHRALRRKLGGAFDSALDEPVPDRLIAALRGKPAGGERHAAGTASSPSIGAIEDADLRAHIARPSATTTSIDASAPVDGSRNASDSAAPSSRPSATVSDIRSSRAQADASARAAKSRAAWSWPQWGAMAASLVIGAIIGHMALRSDPLSPIESRGGHLVAQAGLAEALSNQLASAQPATAAVQIGTTFKARSGGYCRTFVMHEGDGGVAGLACRANDEWRIHTLARAPATPGSGANYRAAGSEMPASVLTAVESEISGDPLDSSGEAQAKDNRWK